jgi:hypothetical protein
MLGELDEVGRDQFVFTASSTEHGCHIGRTVRGYEDDDNNDDGQRLVTSETTLLTSRVSHG